jgi:hypothetical protein
MTDAHFQPVKERYKTKKTDWSEKYLARAPKAVVQAIATYTMGVFKRSSRLSEELMQLIRNFW